MSVPYTFANAVGTIPLSELDSNFAAVEAYSNTAGTVTASAQPNITAVGTLNSLTVVGNVAANYFTGNGSLLTGIVANTTYNNSNVAAFLPSYTGNLTANNVVITGTFVGNGAGLSQIPAANIVGTVANATNATTATLATTASTANSATTATTAGTVTTNAQPNITSVGTLSSVSVTGNVAANYFTGNGSLLTGVVGTADANALTGNTLSANVLTSSLTAVGNLASLVVTANVQAGNVLSNEQVSAAGNITGGNIITLGNVTANYILGNGSALTGLPFQSEIANGNSNIYIENNGNLYVTRGGTAAAVFAHFPGNNVQVFGFFGNIGAQGLIQGADLVANVNITAGNIVTANIVSSNTYMSANTVKTNSTTVGALVSANSAGAGSRAFVTDADSRTFGNLAVGGSANSMPVFSDGSNWYIG